MMRSKLDAIFSGTADSVFAADARHRVVYANRAFLERCPFAPSEIWGEHCSNVIRGKTLTGQRFCGMDCSIGAALSEDRLVDNFDLAVPFAHGGKRDSSWVNMGVIIAPQIWEPVQTIRILRPIKVDQIANRFAGIFRQEEESAERARILTERELEILKLVVEGCSTSAIADHLHISKATARNHIRNIFSKLDVHSRAELVSLSFREGLV